MRKHILEKNQTAPEFREEFCKKSFEGGSGETCSQRFPPKPNPWAQNQKWGWKGVSVSTIFIPLPVGVRTMIIVMMGIAHPHSQASEASAPGGGNQRFPRNEGGRGERSEPTLPPAFRSGRIIFQ